LGNDATCQYELVLVRLVYAVGYALARLASIAILTVFVMVAEVQEQDSAVLGFLWLVAVIAVGLPVTVAVHEAGHLLGCLALRVKVTGVELGSGKSRQLRFTVAGVEVSLGAPYSGRVRHAQGVPPGRGALITAAGPLANLIAAVALFAVSQRGNLAAAARMFSAGQVENLGLLGLALLMAMTGVRNLLPYQTRSGTFSDGARLLALLGGPFALALRKRDASGWLPLAGTPAALHAEFKELARNEVRQLPPEQATRWLRAYRDREPLAWLAVGLIGSSLRRQGRIGELLALHADLPLPDGEHAAPRTRAAHQLEWEVLLVPGLPASAVDLAVGRVEWVLRTAEFKPGSLEWSREAVLHTLALGKLRQGRAAEAEQLCRPILAVPDLPAAARATVLATVALARRAAGLPYQGELAEARLLDPGADLVAEAMGSHQYQGT
jgi:hypothetical protein